MSKKTIKQRIAVAAVSALTAGVLSVVSTPVANAAVVAVNAANAGLIANRLQVATSIAGTAVNDGTTASAKSLGLTFYNDAVTTTANTVARMASSGVLSLYTGAPTDGESLFTASGGTFTSPLGVGTTTAMTRNALNTPTGAAANTRAVGAFTTSGGVLWTPGAAGVYTITLHTGSGVDSPGFAPGTGVLGTTLTVYVGEAYLTLGANLAGSGDTQGVITSSTALSTTVALGTSTISTSTATGRMFLSGQVSGNSSPGIATSAVVVSGGTILSCSTTTDTLTLSTDKSTCSSNGLNVAGISFVAKPNAVGTNMVIQGKTTNDSATWVTGSQITISVVANTTANVFSAADSFLSTEVSGTAADGNIDATYTPASTVGTVPATTVINGGKGYFGWFVKDSNGQSLVGATIVGTATGNCTVGAAGPGTYNSAVSATANSWFQLDQVTANAPTTCVLTVAVNGATVATRSYTMQGELTTIDAPTSQSIVPATAASVNTMFFVNAKDAAGNLLDNVTMGPVTAYYNASLTTVGAVVTKPASTVATDNAGAVTCSASGTYKMQLAAVNASVKTILSPIFDITCGGTTVNYTASLDKASYVPGDIAVLTVKATDSKKATAHDANFLGGIADGTGTTLPVSISGSNMTPVVTPVSGDKWTAGTKTYRFVVGATEGAYNMVVDLPKFNSTTYSQSALTLAYKIAASTATVSNADVLKSIVALIASINKQIQALQKLILRR